MLNKAKYVQAMEAVIVLFANPHNKTEWYKPFSLHIDCYADNCLEVQELGVR